MVIENLTDAVGNVGGIIGSQISSSLGFLIKIGIGAGIAVIVYIIYLIIRGFFQARMTRDIRKMLRVLERIEDKLGTVNKKKRK